MIYTPETSDNFREHVVGCFICNRHFSYVTTEEDEKESEMLLRFEFTKDGDLYACADHTRDLKGKRRLGKEPADG